jgi:pimeloyl-ACP methyl ester carboxylesterase
MIEKHFIPVDNDQEEVAAVHHSADSDRWMFLCHGFGSDKEGSYERRCERAASEGYNAVRFDFRGNGESDREFIKTTLTTRLEDLQAVVNFFDPDSYVLFGSSFGAKTAFHTAIDDDRVTSIMGRAPVTYNRIYDDYRRSIEKTGTYQHSSGNVIDHHFMDDFLTYEFSDVEEQIDIPVAIFHGSADTVVPPRNSIEAVSQFDTDVLLQLYHGEEHGFSEVVSIRLLDQMFDWLKSLPVSK